MLTFNRKHFCPFLVVVFCEWAVFTAFAVSFVIMLIKTTKRNIVLILSLLDYKDLSKYVGV